MFYEVRSPALWWVHRTERGSGGVGGQRVSSLVKGFRLVVWMMGKKCREKGKENWNPNGGGKSCNKRRSKRDAYWRTNSSFGCSIQTIILPLSGHLVKGWVWMIGKWLFFFGKQRGKGEQNWNPNGGGKCCKRRPKEVFGVCWWLSAERSIRTHHVSNWKNETWWWK